MRAWGWWGSCLATGHCWAPLPQLWTDIWWPDGTWSSRGAGSQETPWEGSGENRGSTAPGHTPLSHETSLMKQELKDKIIQNFSTATTEHETISTGPFKITALATHPQSQPWPGLCPQRLHIVNSHTHSDNSRSLSSSPQELQRSPLGTFGILLNTVWKPVSKQRFRLKVCSVKS